MAAWRRKCHPRRWGQSPYGNSPGDTPALVGIVTRRQDWHLVCGRRWYRIPVRTAPEGLEKFKFLAFYQTRLFGPEKWAVNYYAEVQGVRQVRRVVLLPDEPDHPRAEQTYYKLELGEVKPLPRPIPSRRLRRVVFIPTTLERLVRALEINDLFSTSPIENRLYDAARDAGIEAERQFFTREGGEGYMLDMAVFCSDGKLNIECDGDRWHVGKEAAARDRARDNALTQAGWRILRFSGAEIHGDTEECIRQVRRVLKRLGWPGPLHA
jgi:very-short-patch-repair endonuclease